MLFQAPNVPSPYLLGQAVDDLDAGEVALVDRAVEALPGERLLVDAAVRVAVEEAAELVLELLHSLHGKCDEHPGQLLVRKPLAALDRVHEMTLDGVFLRQRDVVAALHHARAAAFTEQAFDTDSDRDLGRGLVGM